jgi:hypothetical protein
VERENDMVHLKIYKNAPPSLGAVLAQTLKYDSSLLCLKHNWPLGYEMNLTEGPICCRGLLAIVNTDPILARDIFNWALHANSIYVSHKHTCWYDFYAGSGVGSSLLISDLNSSIKYKGGEKTHRHLALRGMSLTPVLYTFNQYLFLNGFSCKTTTIQRLANVFVLFLELSQGLNLLMQVRIVGAISTFGCASAVYYVSELV